MSKFKAAGNAVLSGVKMERAAAGRVRQGTSSDATATTGGPSLDRNAVRARRDAGGKRRSRHPLRPPRHADTVASPHPRARPRSPHFTNDALSDAKTASRVSRRPALPPANDDDDGFQVVVRCRPLFGKELNEGRAPIVRCDGAAGSMSISNPSSANAEPPKQFTFDSVYDHTNTQREIYEETALPIVRAAHGGV